MSLPSKDEIYGNCSVEHPDGHLMFRCDRKRADWYLKRDLATIIQDEPLLIRLNFVPKGRGHIDEPYYLAPKENRCVVCGSTKELTRHHAVPHCYRRWLPIRLKSRSSHDVVPLCVDCHERYETLAFDLKKKLAEQYDAPINGEKEAESPAFRAARSSAYAILHFGHQMPPERKAVLQSRIALYLNKPFVTDEDLIRLAKKKRERRLHSYGQNLINKLTDFDEFIRLWRTHFVETMQPKFMSEHWDVNHRLEGDKNVSC